MDILNERRDYENTDPRKSKSDMSQLLLKK